MLDDLAAASRILVDQGVFDAVVDLPAHRGGKQHAGDSERERRDEQRREE